MKHLHTCHLAARTALGVRHSCPTAPPSRSWSHARLQAFQQIGRRVVSYRPAGFCQPPRVCLSTVRRRWTASAAAAATQPQEVPPWLVSRGGSAGRMVLVDTSALMFRIHFGYGSKSRLRSNSDEDTTVVFGVISNIINLLTLNPPPTHLAVVFDSYGRTSAEQPKTFRHELYKGYKAQRPPAPEEVGFAVPRIKAILKTIGIQMVSVPGVEADDVIGTLACRAVAEGYDTAIVSPDKDFFQLLRPRLQILRLPKKNERALFSGFVPYNDAAFENEYGVKPEQWPDVLALAGDTADNIPGVRGIGMTLAPGMVAMAGGLDNLLSHPEQVKRKSAREVLATEEARAAAHLGRILVTIRTDVDFPPTRQPLAAFKLRVPSARARAEAAKIFEELAFKQIPSKLDTIWKGMESAREAFMA